MTIRTPDRTKEPTADRRTVEQWWLHDKPFDAHGNGQPDPHDRHSALTVFEVSHDKARKRYEAELWIGGHSGISIQRVFGWRGPVMRVVIATEPAARYSAKRLTTFAAEAFAALVEKADDPVVASLLNGDPYHADAPHGRVVSA